MATAPRRARLTGVAFHAGKRTSRRPRRRALGLRARLTIGFALAALVVSLSLTLDHLLLARNYLLDQRESAPSPRPSSTPGCARPPPFAPSAAEPGRPTTSAPRATASPSRLPTARGSRATSALQPGRPARVAPRRRARRPVGRAALRLRRRRPTSASACTSPSSTPPTSRCSRWPASSGRSASSSRRCSSARPSPPCGAAAFGAYTSRRLLRPLSRVAGAASELAVGRLRHPARARARPRPRPARQLVQRHGRRRPEPHRA